MHCRMARTCEYIAHDKGSEHTEHEAQYRLLLEFVG